MDVEKERVALVAKFKKIWDYQKETDPKNKKINAMLKNITEQFKAKKAELEQQRVPVVEQRPVIMGKSCCPLPVLHVSRVLSQRQKVNGHPWTSKKKNIKTMFGSPSDESVSNPITR